MWCFWNANPKNVLGNLFFFWFVNAVCANELYEINVHLKINVKECKNIHSKWDKERKTKCTNYEEKYEQKNKRENVKIFAGMHFQWDRVFGEVKSFSFIVCNLSP